MRVDRPTRRGLQGRRGSEASRTAERAERAAERAERTRLRRRFVWTGVSFVIFAAVAGLVLGVLGSPLFAVRSVLVESSDESLAAEAAQQAEGLVFGTVWLPPMREIEGRIGGLSRAEAVRVDRALPSTLTIVVEPRTPVAVVHEENRLMVVDAEGVCLHWTGSPPEGLPRVRIEDPLSLAVGGRLKPADVEMMAAVRRGLEETELLTEARIDLSHPVRIEVLTACGVIGKLGNRDLLYEKALLFGKLLRELEAKGEPPLYIDLRVPSRPTFKRAR